MMVATHQQSTAYYRLTLTHLKIGDHIAFVRASTAGCQGSSTSSMNMTSTKLTATLAAPAEDVKLCIATVSGSIFNGNADQLTDEMFYDEGLLIRPSMRVKQHALITSSTQTVSTSSIIFDSDESTIYVSDYVNGQIQRMESSGTSSTPIITVFANGLTQIMGMYKDSTTVNSDIFACDLHPGNIWRIPYNHPSNPSVHNKVQLTLLTSNGVPTNDNIIELPIDLVVDSDLHEIFVLSGGHNGKVIKLYQTENEVNGGDTYRMIEWMPENAALSLPGTSGMILGGGITMNDKWIYFSCHGTGNIFKMSRHKNGNNALVMTSLVENGYFQLPQDLVLAGNVLLVADLMANNVYIVREGEEEEVSIEIAANDLNYPRGIAYYHDDDDHSKTKLYVTELNPNRVVEILFEDGHGFQN
jgi:hypothetical protein